MAVVAPELVTKEDEAALNAGCGVKAAGNANCADGVRADRAAYGEGVGRFGVSAADARKSVGRPKNLSRRGRGDALDTFPGLSPPLVVTEAVSGQVFPTTCAG